MKHAPILLVLASCFVTAGQAAGPPAPPANLLVCSRMSDPGERLRCYDTQMAALTPAAPSPAPAPSVVASVAAAPPPAPPAPAAKFGADDLKLAARPKEAQANRVLESVITSIHEVRPKLYLITLANGQVWRQEGTQITSFFRVGFNAHIERGLFGEYRMSTHQTGEKNMVSVTRIQ